VARQLFPWALGFVAALITIAVCLIVAVVHRHPVRRMAQDKATAEFR
jgi:H+/gluconate symporter-like permease